MLSLMIASLLFSSLLIMDEEEKFWIEFATWPVWWTVSQFSSAQATTDFNHVTCVLFVATPTNWEYTCTVCGHYSVFCLWPLLQ